MPNREQKSISHTWNEIASQGKVWKSVLEELGRSAVVTDILRNSADRRKFIFLGCGTSYYLAEAAATSWTALTGLSARAIASSEILLFPEMLQEEKQNSCAVAISRSGRTSETLRAASVLERELKIPTACITCEGGSELEVICERSIVLNDCEEKSTVMTRSFTGMLLCLQYLASRLSGNTRFIDELHDVAEHFSPRIAILSEQVEAFLAERSFADFVFLGQGGLHAIAREAALKVMEMSCSYSQAFHTLEFRHGPKAIVSPETCLTFFLSDAVQKAESEVLAEMKELGGTTICICDRATQALTAASDLVLEIGGKGLAWLAPYVIPGQLLGVFTGMAKGLNPDQPKNLTRVVVLD
jgi:glucosamine--fructose-6-phosphate aminotransferase (isomerizing)